MMIDHAKLKSALKTLDSAPKAIEAAKSRYMAEMQTIKEQEASGKFAPVQIKASREQAKKEKDRVIKALAESMKPALKTVRENNDYTGEQLSLDDAKFSNALSVINMLGHSMPLSTQASILGQFRGNPAALSVLEQAYKKNNLYLSSVAHEMQQPVNSQALDEMGEALAFYDHNAAKGIYDLDYDKIRWTHKAFAEQAERMGYDTTSENPYDYALAEESRRLELDSYSSDPDTRARATAQRFALEKARLELAETRKSGGDEAGIFEKALAQVERLTTLPSNGEG